MRRGIAALDKALRAPQGHPTKSGLAQDTPTGAAQGAGADPGAYANTSQNDGRVRHPRRPRPHDRRKYEELVYWIGKTGSQKVRLGDVEAYATDDDIDEVIGRLKTDHERDEALAQVAEAATGKTLGTMRLQEHPDGGFILLPDSGQGGDSANEAASVRGGTPGMAAEKPKPVGSFGQRLKSAIGSVFSHD